MRIHCVCVTLGQIEKTSWKCIRRKHGETFLDYSVNIAPSGLVKFFGNLAIMDSPQQVCETYPAFQNKVFEMALDPDPVMIGVAMDTLGLLGSTVEGKQVLQKTG